MSTTTLVLVAGALVLTYVLVVRATATPVSTGAAAVNAGAGLLSQVGSWWNKNYEF